MASMFKASCSSSSSSSMLQSEKDQVKYKGVRLRKWGKWVSEIRLPNSRERIWLGSYDSAEKAARAFDAAQFCLRGRNAKFNFADNPPPLSINNLVGGRSSLTPAEIQEVASRYANNFDDHEQAQGNNTNTTGAEVDHDDHHFGSHQTLMELDYTSPISSNYSDGAFKMETVDWSFYDMIETNGVAAAAAPGITSHDMNIPDYGLMFNSLDHLHEDMYMNPHLGTSINDHHQNGIQDDQQNVDEHYSHHQSFLWNF